MDSPINQMTVLPVSRERALRLVQQFKQFYQVFSQESLGQLETVYTQDVEFRDPVHTVRGSLALKQYLRGMAANLELYRIRYLDEMVGEDSAYLGWEMDLRHPAIRGGRQITVRGMTRIKFTARVYSHEDCYDLGALLYEHVPLLGWMVGALRRRLGRQR